MIKGSYNFCGWQYAMRVICGLNEYDDYAYGTRYDRFRTPRARNTNFWKAVKLQLGKQKLK